MKQDSGLSISSGSSLILHDSRFALKYDESISTYTIQIKDLQESDAGTYVCSILISTSNQVTATVEVQVRRPLFISDSSTRSVVVSEGDTIEMECHAGGFPPPRITRRRENNAILPTGGTIYRGNKLKIRNIRKKDMGTYYCVAENGVGTASKRNIAVKVEFAPVVTVPKPRLGQTLHHDIALVCQVEAYPPPAITWKKDDIALSNNQHYTISHFSTSDQLTATILRVINIEEKQYGEYICEASNKFGSSTGRVELLGNHPRSPRIAYISQTQVKDVGDKVELACSVQYTADYPILWIKQDSGLGIPISLDRTLILHDSRFKIEYNESISTYTIQIKDLQENDAGTYVCSILISTSNQVTATVEVQVRRPSFISDNSTRSVVVSKGETVEMECHAGGFPPPRITWRRENNAILPTGGTIYRGNKLKIRNIRKDDMGTYYCVAENGVGTASKRNIAVKVEFSPVVTVPKPRLGQTLHHDIALVCQVEAYPPPAIIWKKDDIALSNNQHYTISHFSTSDQLTATILRVINIEEKQYGEYICEASNKFGSSTGRVELLGNHPRSPRIAYISQTQVKDVGDKVELACSVQYTADYPILWIKQDSGLGIPISLDRTLILHDSRFKIEYNESISTYTLQLKDIQETDVGIYACVILKSVSNRVTDTVEVLVRRPPRISDNSTRSFMVSEGEAVEMECYADGYPLPMISWRRENNGTLPTGETIYRGNKLEIKNIRKEDRGTYYCVAENGVGNMSKRNMVEVKFAPVVTVFKRLKQDSMHLVCLVKAFPRPLITWKKGDIVLSNNQQYEISQFFTSDEFTATVLKVTSSEQKQDGEYICEAANEYGISTGRFRFIDGKFQSLLFYS